MGWTCTPTKPDSKFSICTRGGFNSVYILDTSTGDQIDIPREVLVELAAEEVRSHRMSELENMSDYEMLGLPVPEGEE